MRVQKSVNEIKFWQNSLGLLPVPLFQVKKEPLQFVMLNGNTGNFCIDLTDAGADERSISWSSNVDHYLRIKDDKVTVYRWDKYTHENYSVKSVSEKIFEFYNYLKKDKADTNHNVVSFALSVFRRLRLLLRDENGSDSIEAFLVLLACQSENVVDIKKLNTKKWALNGSSLSKATNIRKGDWDSLLELFNNGVSNYKLNPNASLILRHAAGSLFQEANFEANYPLEYQMTLEGLFSGAKKATKGKSPSSSHYTPTSIVRTIVEEILNRYETFPKKLKIIDPACGSGEFLRETIRQLNIRGFKGKLEVYGWDISEIATSMASFILSFEKEQTTFDVELQIITQDALQARWDNDYDIVLMNPPFISWELLNNSQKSSLQESLENVFDKKPNYAAAFLWKAIKSVNNKGYLGLILPSSIFDGDSHHKLRKEMGDMVSTILLGKLGSLNIFSNALVDASVYVCSKEKTKEFPINLWCDYNIESSSNALRELRKVRLGSSSLPIVNDNYSVFKNQKLGKNETWTPVSFQSWKVYESVQGLKTVGDLFDVMQGVRTGMNSIFLVEKNYYSKLPKEEKKYFRPAVTNETLINGKLISDVYIFYPHGEDLEIKSEKDLPKLVKTYFNDFLKPNSKALKNRARRNADNWWKLSEHRAWQVKHSPRLVSKEFGERGSLAFDLKGNFVVERGHCWIPKQTNAFLENEDIGYAYVAIFSMSIINDLLNALSKQIGGGQWYLASKYINTLPVPDLFDNKFNKTILRELADIGRLLSKGSDVSQESIDKYTNSIFNTRL